MTAFWITDHIFHGCISDLCYIWYFMHNLICINQSTAGTMCTSKKLMIRLIIGAWCLLAFVLVTAYQSVLISYIVTPVMQSPLANSIAELANKKDANLVVEKGLTTDLALTVNANFYSQLYIIHNEFIFFIYWCSILQNLQPYWYKIKKSLHRHQLRMFTQSWAKNWTTIPNLVVLLPRNASIRLKDQKILPFWRS